MNPAIDDPDVLQQSASWPAITQHVLILSQLVLAGLVVYLYRIEGPAFLRLFSLTTAGFAIHLALPMNYRLPFFVLLSLTGVFMVFGLADGAWLGACGLVLIGLCHLPISFGIRVAAVLVFGGLLAAARGGLIDSPWSSSVWPILGSMFMFRLVLYMLALKTAQTDRGPWRTLAYFFMLPNLVFPLFPVVDYQTFRRTYYDKSDASIYQEGLLWISRGLVHLLLYRFVYHSVLNDPVDVVRLGDLVQFMLGTFLLYLRVSGQFHLIVGLLHLFGFRLPETHKLYYLAHSFTELWRRINIYWTDFMMKAVFYPAYFKVKRMGPTAALGVATVAVFVTTWFLHSYQWFWLRGGFPLTLPDALFWGILGGLVVAGALRESVTAKKPMKRVTGWSWRLGLRAVTTFSLFCFLWSLWSAESVSNWLWMFGAAAEVDTKGILLISLTFASLLILGGRDWESKGSASRWAELVRMPATRALVSLVFLIAAAQPALRDIAPDVVKASLNSLQKTGLNARDAALQHRGYYEQLDVRAQPNAQVLDAVGGRRRDWVDLSTTGVLRERPDFVQRDLYPSRRVVWNGHSFSTNRWGMRDQDYARDKPPGTLRIALFGPSHVMGNGVADRETFESLVEERLNREFRNGKYQRYEILNFAVDGYTLTQQVALLEERGFDFSPDLVIATQYHRGRSMTEQYLLKMIWRNIPVPHEELRTLLAQAGIANLDRGTIPVPFSAGRNLAARLGLEPRMPYGESAARVRWIADDVVEWSLRRFAEVTASRGVTPLVLGLNAVIDDAPSEIPNSRVIEETRLPLIDLFDVFPEAARPALRVAAWDDHPTAAGHQLIADRLYRELVRFIASTTGGSQR